jgi:exopolyphosphatase/guanosine-5'-triphosphate,3'-diphosphate pyrophosphatase
MVVATIDIGTNTVLLLVVEQKSDGCLSALLERATVTRLGAGVDQNRALAPDAILRTRECLERYAALVAPLGPERVAVVGTSAMRDAAGGDEVKSVVRALFGVEARVLSGTEEARLAFRGGISGLADIENAAVFDIGGGSTEIVIGSTDAQSDQTIAYAQSFDIGSVRLTERLVSTDPPSQHDMATLRRVAQNTFRTVPSLPAGVRPIGVAGTMTTLAAVAVGLDRYDGTRVHGYRLSRMVLAKVLEDLSAMDVAARRSVTGMEPNRADVIVAGGHIALALLDHWKADEAIVSDRGVRWGLAQELVS